MGEASFCAGGARLPASGAADEADTADAQANAGFLGLLLVASSAKSSSNLFPIQSSRNKKERTAWPWETRP